MNLDKLYKELELREEFRAERYSDSEGFPTIGIGFKLDRKGNKQRLEDLGYDFGAIMSKRQRISREDALLLMREDVNTAVDEARQVVPKFDNLDEDRQSVVIDTMFNMGLPKVKKFKGFLASMNKGLDQTDPQQALESFKEAGSHLQYTNPTAPEPKPTPYYQQVTSRAQDNINKLTDGNLALTKPVSFLDPLPAIEAAPAPALKSIDPADNAEFSFGKPVEASTSSPYQLDTTAPDDITSLLVNLAVEENYGTPPEKAAELKLIADKEGVDVAAIKDYLEDIKLDQEKREVRDATSDSPVTRQVLSSPDAYSVLKGNAPSLSAMEHIARKTGALVGGMQQAAGGSVKGVATVVEDAYINLGKLMASGVLAGIEAIGGKDLADTVRKIDQDTAVYIPWFLKPTEVVTEPFKIAGEATKQVGKAISPDNPSLTEEVFGAAGQLAAQAAVYYATGGLSSVTAIALFGQGVDQISDEVVKAGKEDSEYVPLARVLGGSVTAVTERYGLDLIFKRIPAVHRNKLYKILLGAGAEYTQEFLEKLGHNLVLMELINPNQKLVEGAHEEATVAGIVGGLVQIILPGKNHQAIAVSNSMEEINKITQEKGLDKVAAAAASDHRAAIVKEAGISDVTLEGPKLLEWMNKTEQDSSDLIDRLGIADQMEGILNGEEVVIDGEVFAREILGSDNFSSIAKGIKYNNIEMSSDEAWKNIKENAQEAKEELDSGKSKVEETLAKRTSKYIDSFLKADEKVDLAEILNRAPTDVSQALDQLIDDVRKRKQSTEQVILDARVNQIETDIKELDSLIEAKVQEIETREAEGQPLVRANQQLDSLVAKQTALEEEANKLLLVGENAPLPVTERVADAPKNVSSVGGKNTVKTKVKDVINKLSKLQTNAKTLRDLNVKQNKQTIRDVRKAFSEGKKTAKKDLNEARTVLTTFLEKSGLTRAERADFIKTINSVDTSEQLDKKLDSIKARVLKKLNTRRMQEQRQALKKLIKKGLPKTVGGKPEGTTTPELADFFKKLDAAIRMPKAEAAGQLDFNLMSPHPSHAMGYENMVLQMRADPNGVDTDVVEDFLLELEAVLKEGGRLNKNTRLYKIAEVKGMQQTIRDLLGDIPVKARKSAFTKWRQEKGGKWVKSVNYVWRNKLQAIFESSDAPLVKSVLEKLSLFTESRLHDANLTKVTNRFKELVMEKTGLSERQLLTQWQKDAEEIIDLGDFTDVNDQPTALAMTRSEMRMRVMQLKNAQQREQAMHPDGMAYTVEMIAAMEQALDGNAFDQAMMKSQFEFYKEQYTRINEVYRRIYFVNLPHVEFYVPIRKENDSEANHTEFMQSEFFRGGVVPGALKSRVETSARFKDIGDIAALQSNTVQMEYFIAYAEKARFLNQVFKAGDGNRIMEDVASKYGEAMRKTLENDLVYFSNKGFYTAVTIESGLVKLMRNLTFSQLGAKPQIGLKQLVSFSAFAEDVGVVPFLRGMASITKNPRRAFRFMQENSTFFRERGMNMDNDFKALAQDMLSGKFTNFMGRNPSFRKIMMLPIRYGDKGAIFLGGYGHIQAQMKAGKSQAEAIASFERLANKTQQSSDPDQMTEWQRGPSFVRIFTQFMSSANALTRAEIEAFGEFKKGRISGAELTKRFFIYHLLIPNMMQWLANGFNFDEEDQLQASILGSFNGLFILGDALEFAYGKVAGNEKTFGLDARHPLHLFRFLFQGLDKMTDDDVSFEDWFEANNVVDNLLKTGGMATGIPAATMYNELKGLGSLANGELATGTREILGYSPYTLKNIGKGSSSRVQGLDTL